MATPWKRRWLDERLAGLTSAWDDVCQACRSEDSLALNEAAAQLARHARALVRATETRDVFDVEVPA